MFKKRFYLWIQKYFYRPKPAEFALSISLLPLSAIYALIIIFKKLVTKKQNFGIKIISVGNLILGGSGKTPFIKALYREFYKDYKIFIILRGYKRYSQGMILICENGEVLTSVKTSGDEAMEYATSLENANVIVSEDRIIAIKEAKRLGAQLIFLDDGFSKFYIDKFDILLKPNPKPRLNFTIPSGAYRYPTYFYKYANLVVDNNEIIKKTEILNPTKRMVLVSAIANPERLNEYISKCVGHEFFPDHHFFSKDELVQIILKYDATSLLITQKDYVKIKDFNLNLSLLKLNTTLNKELISRLKSYIEFK